MLCTFGFVDDDVLHILAQISIQVIGKLFTVIRQVAPGVRKLLSSTALFAKEYLALHKTASESLVLSILGTF